MTPTSPRLHLFNPANDLALASGTTNYTPPPLAAALHNDGALLPLWYATPGDAVIAPGADRRWVESVAALYSLDVSVDNREGVPSPWGWSRNARHILLSAGADPTLMPDDDTLDKLRSLSGRRVTVEIMSRLRRMLDMPLPDIPVEAHSADDLVSYVASVPEGCFVKAPWSSSGRGVLDTRSFGEAELRRRAEGTIRRQGYMMCERRLDKVHDFAVLFYSDGTKVHHAGLSCFFNERTTAYAGNLLLPDSEIINRLGLHDGRLTAIISALEVILTDIIGNTYIGYLGVDMLTYRDRQGQLLIAPCVELNLRMTMGVVAMLWRDRYLSPDSRGVLRTRRAISEPLSSAIIDSGRLVSGMQRLTPPGRSFDITVEAINGNDISHPSHRPDGL
ncbi:MAG: hypothetical protein NC117_02545 [Pseudoflavonifractor sp.]|nr:hypothetical protein [Pseudoflavonifractor sp.]